MILQYWKIFCYIAKPWLDADYLESLSWKRSKYPFFDKYVINSFIIKNCSAWSSIEVCRWFLNKMLAFLPIFCVDGTTRHSTICFLANCNIGQSNYITRYFNTHIWIPINLSNLFSYIGLKEYFNLQFDIKIRGLHRFLLTFSFIHVLNLF